MTMVDSGFELYVEDGPERGRFITLAKQTIKVGRKSRATRMSAWILLDDPTMSSHHATLVWDSAAQKYRLLHRSKTNPTLLNDRPIDSALLKHNDVIKMGNVVLRLICREVLVGGTAERPRPATAGSRRLGRWRVINAEERILFFHNLGLMLNCGIGVVRSLEALVEQTENPWLLDTLRAVSSDVQGGNSLSGAMQAHSPPFQPVEVGLVRSGESSGTLPAVLVGMAASRQKDLELVRDVKGKLAYPLTVLVAGILVVVFLGEYAFKALLPLLQSTGGQMPFTTRVLTEVIHILDNPLVDLVGLAGGGLLVALLGRYLATPQGTLMRDRVVLYLPLIGRLMGQVAATRFCNSLALLYRSGVPIIRALQEAGETCGNAHVARQTETSYKMLSQGRTLAESLFSCGIFPWYMLSMVDIGETTGRLDDMLTRVAALIDSEVRDSLDRIVKAIEPITVMAMGILVGFIVLAAFQPIYGIITTLQ